MTDSRVEVSEDQADERVGRRTVLRGVAIGGVGLTVLAACGSGDDSGSGTDGGSNGGDEATGSSESPSGDGGGGSGGGGTVLALTSEVPVGGGAVFGDEGIVVTQPAKGTFKAFSATCTHQGCTVASVSDGTINCPCHGSQFSIEDGSVVNGPAPSPLSTTKVTVQGNQIIKG